MNREILVSTGAGIFATLLLGAMIVAGSRNLDHFDAALVAYTFATLFAMFGIAYRYMMWLQRPPTWLYFKRGWQMFLRPDLLLRNLVVWVVRFVSGFVLNLFIWRRGIKRGLAHWLIMWGCVIAVAITFPLVFGWVHFETLPDSFEHYRVYVFGFPVRTIRVESWEAFLMFHGLVWASFLVLPGVMLAMRRRMRDHGAAAVQRFGEDILPLLMLFAITVTGLLLWVSYTWMHGYAYEFLAILHAITVIFTLLWLPFGKFFHIFQRPAQLGVAFYKDAGRRGEQAMCKRCGEAYTSLMHVEDLMTIERQLGYRYDMPDNAQTPGADHYQRYCPKCRRAMVATAQGQTYRDIPDWQQPTTTEGA